MEQEIYLFRGARSIYSNMYPCIIEFDGKQFKNAEAVYQYCKLKPSHRNTHRAFTLLICDGYRAKEYGRTLPLNKSTWDRKKDVVMYNVLKCKFDQHSELKEQLISEPRVLVEENYDKYWGNGVNGEGKNKLGKLLMKLRQEYIQLEK